MSRRVVWQVLVAALVAVGAYGAPASGVGGTAKAKGSVKAKSGFAATKAPLVELNVDSPSHKAKGAESAGTGVTKAPVEGAAGSAAANAGQAAPDSDVNIAEIGRLMETSGTGGGGGTRSWRSFVASSGPDLTNILLRGVVPLLIVLSLILFLYYLMRKFGGRTPLLAGPGLAKPLGKVHLARGTCLHFLQTGGRVLVVGTTSSSVSLVAEFDAAAFEPVKAEVRAGGPREKTPKSSSAFLAQLLSNSREYDAAPVSAADDPELVSLRGDIERLQRHLQELSRESPE